MTLGLIDIFIILAVGLVSAGGVEHLVRQRTERLEEKLDRALRLLDDDRA